jgi:hypothetical protein
VTKKVVGVFVRFRASFTETWWLPMKKEVKVGKTQTQKKKEEKISIRRRSVYWP